MSTGEAIALEAFARVRARDMGVVNLYHPDATILIEGNALQGKDGIRAFYERVIGAGAIPYPVRVIASGDYVAVELRVEVPQGAAQHALDLFEISGGRIRSLMVFMGGSWPDEA